MNLRRYVQFVLLFCCLCGTGQATAQVLTNRIDSLVLAVLKDTAGPGGAFLVARKGQVFYRKAFGSANLELAVPLRPDFVFQLGSMTKQFTAVAILMLEEQGKLKVNDPVSCYVPDYPGGEKITLHHLLTHTAGIKDFTRMKTLTAIAQKDMTPRMMVDFFKNESVDFAPGEQFDYNNSGYVLLGYIIEIVSGQTYGDFIQQQIFGKTGMQHSYYANDQQVIPKRAYGYQSKSGRYVNKTRISFTVPFSSGALMSTVDDMLRWQNALNSGQLLSHSTLQKAFTTYRLNNGEKLTYGYGWHIRTIKGLLSLEHGGSIFGFKTMAVYIPQEDLYVLGFSNCDCHSPTELIRSVAELVLQSPGVTF